MERLRTRGDVARYSFTTTLEGVKLRFRWAWNPRSAAWYCAIEDDAGTVLVQGQRVSPGSPLIADSTITGLPPGRLFVTGPDPYLQAALGDSVQVYYVTAAEVAALGSS